ncbi:hypothetical protein M9Y10_033397 [Tritrichomonas musculus]|uniref:Uncharacterized protein n=1 Tax=Tritrichomonas musculus TaxID=1915356 RepID=A0ABR2KCT9_9EUKA
MNQTQVQTFRLILRNLQNSLVDLAYVFQCRKMDSSEIVSRVASIDSSLYSILSTFDNSLKLESVKQYIETEVNKLNQIKDQFLVSFQDDFLLLKKDFHDFLNEKIKDQNKLTSSDYITSKFNEIERIDNPFGILENLPFPIEEFILSFENSISFEKNEIQPFLDRGVYFTNFFNFLKQLKIIERYKDNFQKGIILDEIIQTNFIQIDSKENNTKNVMKLGKQPNITLKKTMGILKSSNDTLQNSKIGLIKIEAEPLLHQSEKKQPRLHPGSLSLNGLLPTVKNDDETDTNENQNSIQNLSKKNNESADSNIDTDQYDKLFKQIEANKKKLHDWNEIIAARLEQKALLLQKENQILRENIEIVTQQKNEIQQLYEDHLSELLMQNDFLKQENLKLKELEENDNNNNNNNN